MPPAQAPRTMDLPAGVGNTKIQQIRPVGSSRRTKTFQSRKAKGLPRETKRRAEFFLFVPSGGGARSYRDVHIRIPLLRLPLTPTIAAQLSNALLMLPMSLMLS